MDDTMWFPPETAPTDGTFFWAKLSNRPVRMLKASDMIQRHAKDRWQGSQYAYWTSGATTASDRVPYEPSFPEGFIPPDLPRIVGWQPIHVEEQDK